ncbi:YdcH family protein [Pararhizobium mangrovi]|uniref:DUF465 domain-containing protein n=1 Tax=Pararhizobium mangrovi TaxID=2590452 RepID=A0A506TX85_9HYPH|nr:DUF465 domain-containing protein [Pararhizobium mangrovi]TPW26673.1 DUF465 domain-containing protein [Pararhizobium mangrovi]
MTIEAHLASLQQKHVALEEELHMAMQHASSGDDRIADIKRRKLALKDEIERLKSTRH